jgi:hypothetical protein
VDARLSIRIGDAHLGFEAVGVAEEEAQDVSEVGHEAVGRPALNEPCADRVERLDRGSFERKMIEATPTEHGHLALVLGVPGQLEDVQLGSRADPDDGQQEAIPLLEHLVRGVEDARVELDEALAVPGEDGHVVDPAEKHLGSFAPRWKPEAETLPRRGTSPAIGNRSIDGTGTWIRHPKPSVVRVRVPDPAWRSTQHHDGPTLRHTDIDTAIRARIQSLIDRRAA